MKTILSWLKIQKKTTKTPDNNNYANKRGYNTFLLYTIKIYAKTNSETVWNNGNVIL